MPGRDVRGHRAQPVLVHAEPSAEDQFDDRGEHHHDADLPADQGRLGGGQEHEQTGGDEPQRPLLRGRRPGVEQQREGDPREDHQQ